MRLRFDDLVLDFGTREILRGGATVPVSPKAFQLLELLARQRPTALSKEDLHHGLWPDSFVVDGNLANLVAELRRALGDDAQQPRFIRTVQRFGYAFQAQAQALPDAKPGELEGGAYRLIWAKREIALVDGENLMGRDQNAVVWLDDASVSRHHARITIDGSGARLEDLGSKNGTYVGNRKVEKAVVLKDGDNVRLGSVALIFRRFEAGTSTETASRQ